MRVSLNTVKRYTDVDLSVDKLVKKINEQLGGVEDVIDLSERYKDAIIVRVVECVDHPNADRLHVCKIDDGGVVEGVERDEKGYVQVVCGAPNVRTDMFAVWLPPKSTVPSSFDEKELFVLDARELRGVMSNGMMASAKELALGESHDGILEIDPSGPRPNGGEIKPGASFAAIYGLDDTIIDIENKMFTHRPDLFGQLGVAREIAGIQHKQFTSPDWCKDNPEFNRGEGLDLAVENHASETVPRLTAVALKGITVAPSPVWLQAELVRLGGKPINNIVDITNYVMLMTAQPVHAYDYDKLRGHKLESRMARSGETVTLLNGKTYELTDKDIVIADGEGPVGLAGIMGGGESEVSSDTKNIVLEVATFDMYTLRKSSMRHGVFTDALTRFNKGQSPYQNARILKLLISSISSVSSGAQATPVYDLKNEALRAADDFYPAQPVEISAGFINERLGLSLAADEIAGLLANVEFRVAVVADELLNVSAPFWRTDIELREDIVEEIGRLYGFDKLPRVLPTRSTKPAPKNPRITLKQSLRESLRRSGANEVLTYSFVHEKLIKNATQDSTRAFKLSNALSPDLQYYRLSVLPSLLDRVHANIKAGHDQFALYEIGKGHSKDLSGDDGLPLEASWLELVYTSKSDQEGAPYYRAQNVASQLLLDLGVGVSYRPIDAVYDGDEAAPYDMSRSAYIETVDGTVVGVVGELKASVRKAFKLPDYTSSLSLNIDTLLTLAHTDVSSYRPLSRFPKVTQDISLRVAAATSFRDVKDVVAETVTLLVDDESYFDITPRSIYSPEQADAKTLTFRIEIASYARTLTDGEIAKVLDGVAIATKERYGAERI